jgi:pilus assembly protein CpaE
VAILTLYGSKGGVGTSLLATNLAACLASLGRVSLLDLTPVAGGDDLLLDLEANKSWADLLEVTDELTDRHLDLATTAGSDGLLLLSAPPKRVDDDPVQLIRSIADRFDWLVIDAGSGDSNGGWNVWKFLLTFSSQCLLVATLDPLSLRATQRWLSISMEVGSTPTDLVVNQWEPEHPVDPATLATSLGVRLAAVLPYSPREAAKQVNYGVPIMRQRPSSYSRSLGRLIARDRDYWLGENRARARRSSWSK